ncbi:MAG: glycogen/starch/alpha-glucan phosphorylase [Chloroflexota bacterium]
MNDQNSHNPALTAQNVSNRNFRTVEAFKQALADNLYYVRGQAAPTAGAGDVYAALVYTVRDYLVDRWQHTVTKYSEAGPKFVYYLSAEYLLGRQIAQNLLYTGTYDLAHKAVAELGFNLEELIEREPEPALGNGGLGRLAACYMDSLSTLDIPCMAYGIRYEFGIFKQSIRDGWQVESPDDWLYYGNPWEFPQPDDRVKVGFGGHTEYLPAHEDGTGEYLVIWHPAETILGEPSHMLMPGYKTGTVNMLRLWQARASEEFNFQLFDVGDYSRAAEQKIYSENITKVLYPNDNTPQGRELRLRQEYFFCCCSLQDILRRFTAFDSDWDAFPRKVVIQLNDTHPVVAIPELMRLLVDYYGLEWGRAWEITRRSFAYTCHTLMPEALEKWPVSLFERLLPRHMEIIYEINRRFLLDVEKRFPDDPDRLARMSLIEEGGERMLRMAYLATVGSFSVNGVAELHSELLREYLLPDFYELWPEKFNNKTNGVTPRRFMRLANPSLSRLIDSRIGEGWLKDLESLRNLEAYADDAGFQSEWRAVKLHNKGALAATIRASTGLMVDPNAMFDIMVKRLHEYKRQILKVLHIVTLYNRLRAQPRMDIVPRTFVFGAKSAPGYHIAKLIIKLINSVAEVVNYDPLVAGRLKVVFMPNFNVSLGEKIYPAAELSEQISLAGFEASGTGNMKFALNGALTIGTLDGANIEIRERVGAENFFLFGLTANEAMQLKAQGYSPFDTVQNNPELNQAIAQFTSGYFTRGDTELFRPLVDNLLHHDPYLVTADYASYIAMQDEVDRAYRDIDAWTRKSIFNTARCGFFSSDRAIRQYNDDIWKISPLPVEE